MLSVARGSGRVRGRLSSVRIVVPLRLLSLVIVLTCAGLVPRAAAAPGTAINSEFMPPSFYKNLNDLRPAIVHSAGYIENRDTDCTNLVQIQESVPSRETIPSISIAHSASKRNWAT